MQVSIFVTCLNFAGTESQILLPPVSPGIVLNLNWSVNYWELAWKPSKWLVLTSCIRWLGQCLILIKTASESRETESRPEASSHRYWIQQLDTRKTVRVNFTYVWLTLLRKLNHKYESFCANIKWIFPVFPIISTCECVDKNLQSPSLSRFYIATSDIAHVAIPAATFLNSLFTSNVRFCWYQIVSCAVHCSAA